MSERFGSKANQLEGINSPQSMFGDDFGLLVFANTDHNARLQNNSKLDRQLSGSIQRPNEGGEVTRGPHRISESFRSDVAKDLPVNIIDYFV